MSETTQEIVIQNSIIKKLLENEVFIKYKIDKENSIREKLPAFRDMS